jgi:MFS family permease
MAIRPAPITPDASETLPGAVIALPPQPPSMIRRNYRLGVSNGVLFTLGDALSNAGLVLALLVRQLGGSLTLVGLLPALQGGGYLLPQMLVGGHVQAMPYKLPFYRRAAFVRLGACLALTIMIGGATVIPAQVSVWLIIVCYSVFNLSGGTSTLAFQDVVAKVIPPRRRGSFFGTRQLLGGLLAFALAGPLVRWLLARDGPLVFPDNFAVLSGLSLLCYAGGMYAMLRIDEPAQAPLGPQLRVIEGLRRAPALMRQNDDYRWFVISRMLTRIGQVAEPFYIIYATEALRLPAGVAGIYLAVRAIAGALSNLFWGRLSDRQGTRRLVLISGALIVGPPALVLLGPAIAAALGLGSGGVLVAMALVFLAVGAANDGSSIAGTTYLLEVVPEDERPIYLGLANTLLGLVTFLPVLAGWLIGRIGYPWTFGIGLLFALLGLVASLRLGETDAPQRRAR